MLNINNQIQIKATCQNGCYQKGKQCVGKDVKKGEHFCTVGRNVNSAATMENCRNFSKKAKIIQSLNSISGYLSKENENTVQKDVSTHLG